jgi:drug/metabolite transporter (DMT)-like permease
MGALFGLFASFSVGGSELFGRRVANSAGAVTISVSIQGIAGVAALVTALVFGDVLGANDMWLGALSGIGFGIGMISYLHGLTKASSAIIAPTVATLSAMIPFGYTIVTGARPSPLSLGGAALSVAGLVLVSAGGAKVSGALTGWLWGLAAGLGYGFGMAVLVETSSAGGSWPAVSQRGVALAMTLIVAHRVAAPLLPPSGVRFDALAAGIFAGLSSIFYLIGVQANAPAATVTGALFPAVSVAVGRMLFHDSVTRTQALGVTVVLLGVVAVVAG